MVKSGCLPNIGFPVSYDFYPPLQALTAAPVPAAALQPPAPGQFFGNRPSFSYNVVSHANARLPTGQQFQPDAVISHGFIIISIVLYTSFFIS